MVEKENYVPACLGDEVGLDEGYRRYKESQVEEAQVQKAPQTPTVVCSADMMPDHDLVSKNYPLPVYVWGPAQASSGN